MVVSVFKTETFEKAPFDIIDGDRGKNYPKQDEFFDNEYCLFLNTGNVTANGFNFEKCSFVTKEKDEKLRKGKLKRNDIVLTTRGTIGNAAFYNQANPFDNIRINSGMVILRPKDSIEPKYLYLFVKSPLFTEQTNALRSGTAQPQLPIGDMNRVEIPLPSLPIQRKIASILSAYDDLIENNTRRIKILEEMAQAIYRHWFIDFKFPGHKKTNFVPSPQTSPSGRGGKGEGRQLIPEGWERKKVGDLAEEMRRSIDPSTIAEDTPYFGLEHLPRKSIALGEWGFAKDVQSSKLAFRKGEILFGKIRPYFHKVGVAPIDGVCSSDTIVIKPKAESYFGIVLGCVSSEAFVNHASQTSHGTKMPRANWNVLLKYPVVMPPDSLLARFNKQMQNTVDLIHNLIFKNLNLRRTRDTLLPKLINGEIEV